MENKGKLKLILTSNWVISAQNRDYWRVIIIGVGFLRNIRTFKGKVDSPHSFERTRGMKEIHLNNINKYVDGRAAFFFPCQCRPLS